MNQLAIVICTCNRAALVGALIRHFDKDVISTDNLQLEVIIVDNNSTDDTGEVVSRMAEKNRWYELRYVIERRPGLSNARNRGVREASSALISFLDDDAVPERSFLFSLSRAFARHDETECFAHKVINHPVNKPDWYAIVGKYAMLNRGNYDLGRISRFLQESDPVPIGSGMVISKSIYHRYGPFDSQFGYDITRELMVPGEETELFYRIRDGGVPIFYVHDAVVHHYPQKEKYDLGTLCRTYTGIGFWYGANDARKCSGQEVVMWARYPLAYYRRVLRSGLFYLISRLSVNKTVRNYYRFQMRLAKGYLKGFRSMGKPSSIGLENCNDE